MIFFIHNLDYILNDVYRVIIEETIALSSSFSDKHEPLFSIIVKSFSLPNILKSILFLTYGILMISSSV